MSWYYSPRQETATLPTQMPPSLVLHHQPQQSDSSTDVPLWSHLQSQNHIFGGPPVTQTVTTSDDLATIYSSAALTPPLTSTNPGFYGWTIHSGGPTPNEHHSSTDLTYQLPESQTYFPSVVMTPESDTESSFGSPLTYLDSAGSIPYMPYLSMAPHNATISHNQAQLQSKPSLSPPLSPDSQARRRVSIEELRETQQVKLTRMTPERIAHITQLAEKKGINRHTVASVLTLYTSEGRKRYLQCVGGDQSELCGDDIVIQITLNGGFPSSEDGAVGGESKKKMAKNHRKARPDYVKRPLNSFMLYRKSQTQSAMAYAMHSQLKLNHQNISQIIGLMWQTESKQVKDQFASFAGKEKELHRVLHPDYKFCPQKKKRKD